jgi:drug/metabolite transporter superfamily protein YnfA
MRQMGQQQRQKPSGRPRSKRTAGELVAAWLVLAWGAITALYFFPVNRLETDLESRVLMILFISQGITCFLGGLAALLRLRKGTQVLLTLVGLCFLSVTGIFLGFSKKYGGFAPYLVPLVISALIGLVFLALGRWFGRLEDTDTGDVP